MLLDRSSCEVIMYSVAQAHKEATPIQLDTNWPWNFYLWSPTGIIVECFFFLNHRLWLNVSISCMTPASNMTMPFVTAKMQIEQTMFSYIIPFGYVLGF